MNLHYATGPYEVHGTAIMTREDGQYIRVGEAFETGLGDAGAHALLFAAAPVMLEELKLIRSMLRNVVSDDQRRTIIANIDETLFELDSLRPGSSPDWREAA